MDWFTTGNISPTSIQFTDGSANVELITGNRLINNLNLAYSPNGNGNSATVSVANGWPASSIATMSLFENSSNYSAVMGQASTAVAQGIELNNLRVTNANHLSQFGKH